MKLLVAGGGGREHAIAWQLARDPAVSAVYVAPGNPGMESDAKIRCAGIGSGPGDFDRLAAFVKSEGVAFVVVGPDQALADGLVDYLESRAIPAFGPSKRASRIEWSKAYAKERMRAAGIPTAAFESFSSPEAAKAFLRGADWSRGWVVKADGLALGKGVVVCGALDEALAAVDGLARATGPGRLVVEERLRGREASAFFLCDGERAVPLGLACDYKRIFDDDQGPNTGGMGAFTPADWLPPGYAARICREVAEPLLREMRSEGCPFHGVLFAGLMIDGEELRVLEFNARFGDPETQALLPLLEEPLLPWLRACRDGRLGTLPASGPKLRAGAAVHVVSAAAGYPGTPRKGDGIQIEPELAAAWEREGVKLFFAGVARAGGGLVTSGGRVLGVTALGRDRAEARGKAYAWSGKLSFEGCQRRGDVGR